VNLRELAALDHAAIVSDVAAGFGLLVTVTNPEGVSLTMGALASDVGEVIDPQSGMAIDGRRVTVQLLPGPLAAAGMGEVRLVADGFAKPWLVRFADVHGVPRTFKVIEIFPDRYLGSIRCRLEGWKP
jgi:hypothetical protein